MSDKGSESSKRPGGGRRQCGCTVIEVRSPEAAMVESYDASKSGILCARRGTQTRCMVFAGSALYLDAAQRRLRMSSGGNAELQPAQAAQVCSCATRRRRYLVSHRLACVVVLSAEKSVELR